MIVPDYWAEARRQYRKRDRQITVRRFGWSSESQAAAEAMAAERAEDALRRLVAGERLRRREPRVPYNGAEGVPIREEVLARHGEQVITRNSYGAQCLNSPSVLFADIDLVPPSAATLAFRLFTTIVTVAVGVSLYRDNWAIAVWSAVAALFAAWPLATLINRSVVWSQGGLLQMARLRLAQFIDKNPSWNVRVYETPAGLRLLATHQRFDPRGAETLDFFSAVGADPVYVRMCKSQNCFRARLTAKPWRIGIDSHLRPRPGTWPVNAERLPDRVRWVERYEQQAARFAACRFVESIGSGMVHADVGEVVALHDRLTDALASDRQIA